MDLSDSRVAASIAALELTPIDLEFMLWDRLFDSLLKDAGKRMIIEKTPSNAFLWEELVERWPEARFIILRRDPAAVARSVIKSSAGMPPEEAIRITSRFVLSLDQAAAALEGRKIVVRYEEIVAEPEATIARVCEFLDVDFEPAMLDYGTGGHGPFAFGLGDWGESIHSGRIQPINPDRIDPAQYPELAAACAAWGYPV